MNKEMQIFSGKRVLVTGGSGFIGTNLIGVLLSCQVEVLNADIVEPRNKEFINSYREVNLNNLQLLQDVFQQFRPHYVIHLAARTDLNGSSIKDYECNTVGVENLCKLIAENNHVEKVVFASSMLVCKAGYLPSNDYDYNPTTVYGESKVVTEQIIREYSDRLPEYTIVRPTSIWGPWFAEPYLDFFKLVLDGKYVDMGLRSCTKTYGYVGNSVNQILNIFNLNNTNRRVIYLGDAEPLNISKWAKAISYYAGSKKVIPAPFMVLKLGALLGDLLKLVNVKFPLTSFRLKNMTTNNIIPATFLVGVDRFKQIDLDTGIRETLKLLN